MPAEPGASHIQSLVPHASLVLFVGVGHALYIERARAIAQYITRAVLQRNSVAGTRTVIDADVT